uniref:Derlin n=1 Tax=Pyramimonas obovata TaxID=1411642 RepID=A0A7S0RBT6_9CHLO|mmetsp:Transcript_3000/g.6228  ORF Transcript_3000/g.6228 Transcript_3000/m.6228 type:complete len:438 (+) Transcript_3000:166-1479(+)|eukprot:CAMPEP_0118924028 /NCGR_PEP_ID=MMETSP1169-20130426/2345_1 /TAXON_ID=36882 /ORGANISM="Pyramimonas obovata, Strain CCMP722" /LENGTH=437 /DNA_ID=CAMNT_0006865107 /DNA_START=160 /DNA_END=1473 /DNA_ORIENTATION=-
MDWREFYYTVPLATRSIMVTITTVFVLSPFFPATLEAVSACPYYILFRLQIYRLLLSGFVSDSILGLLLGLLLIYRYGLLLEQEKGSLHFGYLCAKLIVLINALICVAVLFLSPLNPLLLSPTYASRGGTFPLLLALITIQTQRSPNPRTSFMGFFTVPTEYFPLLLLAIFVLLGGSLVETAAAVGIGYAQHYGYLARTEPAFSTLANIESSSYMRSVVNRRGYINTSAAGVSLPLTNQQADGSRTEHGGMSALRNLLRRTQNGAGTEQRFPGRGQSIGGTSAGAQRSHFGISSLLSGASGRLASGATRGADELPVPNGPAVGPPADASNREGPSREARAAAFLRAHEQRMREMGVIAQLQPMPQDEPHGEHPNNAVAVASEPAGQAANTETIPDVDREDIDRLIEMGFTGSQAVRSLRLTRGNLEAAAELLVSGNV